MVNLKLDFNRMDARNLPAQRRVLSIFDLGHRPDNIQLISTFSNEMFVCSVFICLSIYLFYL